MITGSILFLLLIPIALALFVFWIWMLIDALMKEDGANKIAWVLVIILLPVIGTLIYFFGRKLLR